MERLFSISVKVVVSILFQKARKVLNNERGEANYFSTVVFIFIAVLLLAFIIDLFSIISTKQELDHAADQMVKQIQLSGGVNSETDELFEFLSSQIEGAENISYSIDATYTSPRPSGMTNAIQLGTPFFITIEGDVSAHERTLLPMGTLANGDLRHKRILAHRALKKLQQDCQMEKWEVYIWLQAKLGLDARQTHIGQFSEYMCEQVISLCQQAPVYTSGRAA